MPAPALPRQASTARRPCRVPAPEPLRSPPPPARPSGIWPAASVPAPARTRNPPPRRTRPARARHPLDGQRERRVQMVLEAQVENLSAGKSNGQRAKGIHEEPRHQGRELVGIRKPILRSRPSAGQLHCRPARALPSLRLSRAGAPSQEPNRPPCSFWLASALRN